MKKKRTIPTDNGPKEVNSLMSDMMNFNLMDHLVPCEPTPERQKELEEIYKQVVKSLPTEFKGPAPKMWFTGSQEDWDKMDPKIKKRFENGK